MVFASRSLIYDLWSMTYDRWPMIYGLWSMTYALWSMISDLWSMICDDDLIWHLIFIFLIQLMFCSFWVFFQILSTMLDPLLQSCALSATRLNSVDMATYYINCLYQIQSTLSVFEFTDVKIEMLAGQVCCIALDFKTQKFPSNLHRLSLLSTWQLSSWLMFWGSPVCQ